jgi:outer membrane protein TolC
MTHQKYHVILQQKHKRNRMMKRIPLISLLLILDLLPLKAQEMTLGQCIDTAIRCNRSLDNSRIEVLRDSISVRQSRAMLRPTVNGNAQMTGYMLDPVNVTTGTLLGNDFPDDPTWNKIKSTSYQAVAGIQAQMPIYNATVLAAVEVSKMVEKVSRTRYEKAEEDLTVQVAKIYYLAQTTRKLTQLADENIQRMREMCDITEAMYDEGLVLEIDLNRVRINLQNIESERHNLVTLHEQQLNLLRFLMDMSPDSPLEVTALPEDITDGQLAGVSSNLPELRLLGEQSTLIDKQIKAVKAGYQPSLGVVGYFGAVGYQEEFHHWFSGSEATDNWFGNSFIGLQLRVPIYDGGIKRMKTRSYKLQAEQISNNRELLRSRYEQEYANASLQFTHNREVLETQRMSQRQAEGVYEVTSMQYKAGVASMTSLLQDDMQLRQAQASCVQAIEECLLARLDLLRLSGSLGQLKN